MNVIKTGDGRFIEVQGTAEGAPFARDALDELLELAGQGIAELVEHAARDRRGIHRELTRDERAARRDHRTPASCARSATSCAGLDVELRSLADLPPIDEPEETGATFEENARAKARYYAHATGLLTVADDSGLEIDALDGAPGVHSARFPGETYAEKFADLFRDARRARARRAAPRGSSARCASRSRSGVVFEARGVVEGEITREPRGERRVRLRPDLLLPAVRPDAGRGRRAADKARGQPPRARRSGSCGSSSERDAQAETRARRAASRCHASTRSAPRRILRSKRVPSSSDSPSAEKIVTSGHSTVAPEAGIGSNTPRGIGHCCMRQTNAAISFTRPTRRTRQISNWPSPGSAFTGSTSPLPSRRPFATKTPNTGSSTNRRATGASMSMVHGLHSRSGLHQRQRARHAVRLTPQHAPERLPPPAGRLPSPDTHGAVGGEADQPHRGERAPVHLDEIEDALTRLEETRNRREHARRQAKLPGQVVAGAERQEPQRGRCPGQGLDGPAHRAVAAGDDDRARAGRASPGDDLPDRLRIRAASPTRW